MAEHTVSSSSNNPQVDRVIREILSRGFSAVFQELQTAQGSQSTPGGTALLHCLNLERQHLDAFYPASVPKPDDGLYLVQHLRERAHHNGYDQLRTALDTWLAASGHLHLKSLDAWRSPAPAGLIGVINVGVNVSPGLPVAFSRDGSRIISIPTPVIDVNGVHKLVQVWDAHTGTLIRQLDKSIDKVEPRTVAVSNDGRLAVFGSLTLELWNLDSATLIRKFEGHTRAISAVAYSLDGTRIASCSDDGTVRVWDVSTGKELCQISKSGNVARLTLSRDGRRVCWGSNTVHVWHVEPKEEVFIHDYHRGYFPASISADGRRVAVAMSDGSIHLYDLGAGAADGEPRILTGHTDAVFSFSFSEDGTRLLSGSKDGTIRLWNVESGETLHLYHNDSAVYSAQFADDGRAVTVSGNLLKIWNFTVAGEKQTAPVQVGTDVAISADGNWIMSGYDKILYRWETLTGAKGYAIDFTALNGTQVESAPLLGKLPDAELRKHSLAYIVSIDISQDGTRVLTGSGDKVMRLWDLQTGNEIRRWVNAGSYIALSPDGLWAATASRSEIRIWNTNNQSETEVLTWKATTTSFVDIAFAGNGTLLLSGAASPSPAAVRGEWEVIYDDSLRLWDTSMGAELGRINVDSWQNELLCLAPSPSGHLALSAAKDGLVRLWDLRTGQEIRQFKGHTDEVGCVAFSPDERWALSAGKDRSVRIWDVQTGTQLAILMLGQIPRRLALSATNPPTLVIGAGQMYVMTVMS